MSAFRRTTTGPAKSGSSRTLRTTEAQEYSARHARPACTRRAADSAARACRYRTPADGRLRGVIETSGRSGADRRGAGNLSITAGVIQWADGVNDATRSRWATWRPH